ncbi:DUF2292 domain-containing protein [Candidatus Gottesmanbacteria bacterium]|nr:DUF2292 domain-containing protein [Candidatus Gottesmanbacteria bacterium]
MVICLICCPEIFLPKNFCPKLSVIFDLYSAQQQTVNGRLFNQKITKDLVTEVKQAIKNVRGWGSVEIYVQDYKVTQITERNIKKTNHNIRNL